MHVAACGLEPEKLQRTVLCNKSVLSALGDIEGDLGGSWCKVTGSVQGNMQQDQAFH